MGRQRRGRRPDGVLDEGAHAQDVVLDGLLLAIERVAPGRGCGAAVALRVGGLEQGVELVVDARPVAGVAGWSVMSSSAQPNRPET